MTMRVAPFWIDSVCIDTVTARSRLAVRLARVFREHEPPRAARPRDLEPTARVGGQRPDVDGRLGVGGEHHERLAGREPGERRPRLDGRERAREPTGVEQLRHTICMMIAAILESGRLERLYTGLSLLVSAAADGRPARGLVSFGALAPLLDAELEARAVAASAVADAQTFARSLAELRDTARQLEDCRLWACAAAVELTGASRALVEERLDGVMSTPRFLREVAGAELVVV